MNSRVATFLIVVTAIIAIAGFLLVSFLVRPGGTREATPQPRDGWLSEDRLVNDVVVVVEYDPGRAVFLPQVAEQPPAEQPTQPPAPTATTDPAPTEAQQPAPTTPPGGGTVVTPIPPVGQGQGSGAQKVIRVSYFVRQGDTLFSIAQYHNNTGQPTSVALMARYGIGSDHLAVGEELKIPVANPAYCPGRHTYVVLEGDNAFRIAMKYNVNVEWLRQNNNLDSNYTVYVTDILCVP